LQLAFNVFSVGEAGEGRNYRYCRLHNAGTADLGA